MNSYGSDQPVARLLYRISEAAVALGLSKAKVYELINSGAIKAVRIDGARRIRAADLEAFVASLGKDAACCPPRGGAGKAKAPSTGAQTMDFGSGCSTWGSWKGGGGARPCTAKLNGRCFKSSARCGRLTTAGSISWHHR